jgi:hypothetical protein
MPISFRVGFFIVSKSFTLPINVTPFFPSF